MQKKLVYDSFSEIVLFLARYSFLFEESQNSVNFCTSEVMQIYTEQAFSDWSMKYVDPDGKVIAHFSPIGWSHHAPQRVFGYFDVYDAASVVLGFNINGTKLTGNDFTVRMWKGNYGLCGVGGEIGLYSKNGKSLNRNELSSLGLESSSFDLIDNNSKETLISRKEEKQSFWTTGFKPLHFGKKTNLTATFSLNFKDEKAAKNFYDQIKEQTEKGYEYYWNDSLGGKDKQNISVKLSDDKRSVIFRYGNMEE